MQDNDHRTSQCHRHLPPPTHTTSATTIFGHLFSFSFKKCFLILKNGMKESIAWRVIDFKRLVCQTQDLHTISTTNTCRTLLFPHLFLLTQLLATEKEDKIFVIRNIQEMLFGFNKRVSPNDLKTFYKDTQ